MDDRELNFSKSEDEQSEMSNHDYDHDIKPVRYPIFHGNTYVYSSSRWFLLIKKKTKSVS